jgi:hypothetical protein
MVSEGRRAGSVRGEQVNCADPPASTCWLSGCRSSTVPRLNKTVAENNNVEYSILLISLLFPVLPVFIVLVHVKSMYFGKHPRFVSPR